MKKNKKTFTVIVTGVDAEGNEVREFLGPGYKVDKARARAKEQLIENLNKSSYVTIPERIVAAQNMNLLTKFHYYEVPGVERPDLAAGGGNFLISDVICADTAKQMGWAGGQMFEYGKICVILPTDLDEQCKLKGTYDTSDYERDLRYEWKRKSRNF